MKVITQKYNLKVLNEEKLANSRLYRCVFRNLPNIFNETSTFNYFRRKNVISDVWQDPKYTSECMSLHKRKFPLHEAY